jgi:hypothetical protein
MTKAGFPVAWVAGQPLQIHGFMTSGLKTDLSLPPKTFVFALSVL